MPTAELTDRLATLVETANTIPLTDQARLNRAEVYGLLDELRSSLPAELGPAGASLSQPALEFLALVSRIDDLVRDARAVPLTNQVRVARGEITGLVDQLRTKLAQALEPQPESQSESQPGDANAG